MVIGGGMCHFGGMCIGYMLKCIVFEVVFLSVVPQVSTASKFEGLCCLCINKPRDIL